MNFTELVASFEKHLYPRYLEMVEAASTAEGYSDPELQGYLHGVLAVKLRNIDEGTPKDRPDDQMEGTLVWALARWIEGSRARFELTSDLALLLQSTKTKGVSMEWLQLPANPLLIMYPPGLPLVPSLDGKFEDLMCTLVLPAESTVDAAPQLQMLHVARGHNPFAYHRIHTDYATIDEAAAGMVDTVEAQPELGDTSSRTLLRKYTALLDLTVNTILYINSGEEKLEESMSKKEELQKRLKGTTSPGKRRKLARMIAKADPYPTFVMGKTIALTGFQRRELTKQYKQGLSGKPLVHCISVRGHWRNQPYGPEHMLRKLIWIKPHRKGPQNTTEVIRSYLVDKPAPH